MWLLHVRLYCRICQQVVIEKRGESKYDRKLPEMAMKIPQMLSGERACLLWKHWKQAIWLQRIFLTNKLIYTLQSQQKATLLRCCTSYPNIFKLKYY